MSEISPTRIELFGDSVDAWVQIACPRLVGEGEGEGIIEVRFKFELPLRCGGGWEELLGSSGCRVESCSSSNCGNGGEETEYPMDYYAQDGGEWNSSYMKKKPSAGDRKAHSRVGKQPIS
uniref:Uncharacterized protein n=1 Tax=Ananas comosus var. bracteatus TaxID=296719 RepID=A0A6V7PJ13_ANACO|nr:unnamed protein product [Ananas comosus var. bracteatus]